MSSAVDSVNIDSTIATPIVPDKPVVTEINNEPKVGEYVGQCKWFNDKLGYGFVTVQSGEKKGKDIFVHHTGICPLNSNYKTLKKGEYVNFDVTEGDNGLQAVNVTGIGGGSLICDVSPQVRYNSPSASKQSSENADGFVRVHRRLPSKAIYSPRGSAYTSHPSGTSTRRNTYAPRGGISSGSRYRSSVGRGRTNVA